MANDYRVKLEWIESRAIGVERGRVSYTITVGNHREAKRMERRFSNVALVRRATLQSRRRGADWKFDVPPLDVTPATTDEQIRDYCDSWFRSYGAFCRANVES